MVIRRMSRRQAEPGPAMPETRLCRGTRAFANMHFVYVLEAHHTGRLYVGMTENVEDRLKEHNAGRVGSTKGYRPYSVIYTEKHPDKTSARKREIQIKESGVIRKDIKEKFGRKNGSIV